MTVLERTVVAVSMEAECQGGEECERLAARTFAQLNTDQYRWPCSVLEIPSRITEWEAAHRTARKRAWRCERLGYRFQPVQRHLHEQDVFEINTSAPERQGRPMSDSYQRPVRYDPNEQLTHGCARHGIHTYGVLDPGGRLRAYTWVYRVGDLMMLSQILGHHDHLKNAIMYLLLRGSIAAEVRNGPGVAFYNRWDSGSDGLRFMKERCGFQPAEIRWSLT